MVVNQKYSIYGKVFDGASNLLSGVTVNLINGENGEELPAASQGTTDANGEYSINAENFVTSITNGQGYEVVFSKKGYDNFKVVGTFNTAGAGDEIIIDLMLDGIRTDKTLANQRPLTKLSQSKTNFMVWANNKTLSGNSEILTSGGAGRGKGVWDSNFK